MSCYFFCHASAQNPVLLPDDPAKYLTGCHWACIPNAEPELAFFAFDFYSSKSIL
jgi:hypothetical protein